MKLVTWNTQWCCGLDGRVDPARIVEVARELADFDVLCLQEVSQGFETLPGRPGDQPAQLAACMPGFHVSFGPCVDEVDAHGRPQRFGNLVASRLPVLRVQHLLLPWPSDPSVSSMPRMCTAVTVKDPGLGLVRVMTTHLEYHSSAQRSAQARALRDWHIEACRQAAAPPAAESGNTPFRPKPHTLQAILCGDFNMPGSDPSFAALGEPFDDPQLPTGATSRRRLVDAWTVAHPSRAQDPTFRLHDDRYGKDPVACDFVLVSDGLVPRVRHMVVDGRTQASDHQPVMVELDG